MFLPYGTGALLVRDGAALRAAHEATAAYLPAMPHPEDFYDPSQHGPELSRGFSGLRVWLSVKLFGSAAFRLRDCRKAPARRRRLAPRGRPSRHRHRCRTGPVAVCVSPDVAGCDRGRRRRGDESAARGDHSTRARDADRLHGARPFSRAGLRPQFQDTSAAHRPPGRRSQRVDPRDDFSSTR